MSTQVKEYGELLTKYLRPQKLRVALMTVLLFSSIGLQLANPQIVRYFIDTASSGGALSGLLWAAAAFLCIALLTQAISVAATYVGENIGWTATNMLRVDLALHCLRLDMPFHKTHTPGEMIERIDGDVTALSKFFSQFVIQVLGNVLLMVGVLIMLFREDWRLGLALAAFAVVAVFLLHRMRNVAVPAVTAERQASAEQFGFLEERLAGLQDIRGNGAGAHVMRGMYEKMRGLYNAGRTAWRMDAILWLVAMGLVTIGVVLVLGLGTLLFKAGAFTLGTIYLLFQYTEMLRRPLDELTDQLRDLQKASAGIGRVRELFGLQPEIVERGTRGTHSALRTPHSVFAAPDHSVEFEGVSFGYGEDEMVLRELTFRLEAGKVLGVLGRTGSGKTTITRLLFRLYDPAQGTVRVGGEDIRDARLADLRKRIGMVTQDVQLFEASLRDNLTLFDTTVPDERILEVLRDVGLYSWYMSLPKGLDTELGPHGAGLSAGESQLLAFCRVFLKDPGLVILDEASSRLDPATEQLIERAVSKLLRGRTGIIIAHRLPTVQRADEILILDGGQVLEHGPRALLASDHGSRFSHLLRTGLEEVLV